MEVAFVYSDVFNKAFNLEFHEPKKDQCLMCAKFKISKKMRRKPFVQSMMNASHKRLNHKTA